MSALFTGFFLIGKMLYHIARVVKIKKRSITPFANGDMKPIIKAVCF